MGTDCDKIQNHVAQCDECQLVLRQFFRDKFVREAGRAKSEAKTRAARINGRKGGRPRKVNCE